MTTMSSDISQAYKQKERELQLVLALDAARDATGTPQFMFDAIASLLETHFAADAVAIMLLMEKSTDPELLSAVDIAAEDALNLCKSALSREKPGVIDSDQFNNVLGMQIQLHQQPLGAMIIARQTPPFDSSDLALVELAESQIDSAVIQARNTWSLIQRNKELEAIYQIDRLRDLNLSENELVARFTTIVKERLDAELCMITLSNPEDGEFITRGIQDKHAIPATMLDTIRRQTEHIERVGKITSPDGLERFTLLAAPFIVANVKLGAVVIGREVPFSHGDIRMLTAMTSQMDSSVVFSRLSQQLAQRNKELETIYRIDRIRDTEDDFEMLLQRVLVELCEVVSSEIGYMMLYDDKEQQLELKSCTCAADLLLTSPEYYDVIRRVSHETLESGALVYSNNENGAVRSILAVPLILNDAIIGVFGTLNSNHGRGFNSEDRRMLTAITSQVDTAVFERIEQRQMRNVLSRSVDPKVLEHLLHDADTGILHGERVILSVLFADLRGSTQWAERIGPDELVQTINAFLGKMTETIFKFGGTLDKFVGDEVIALFGTPLPMDDHAHRATMAGLEMQRVHKQLQTELMASGHELPPMGIGISSGEAVAGEFGAPLRTGFTAMGRIVNLGSRICGAALADQVLISETTYQMAQDKLTVNALPTLDLKGISKPVAVYEVVRVKGQTTELPIMRHSEG